jgi:hypothetical protein
MEIIELETMKGILFFFSSIAIFIEETNCQLVGLMSFDSTY